MSVKAATERSTIVGGEGTVLKRYLMRHPLLTFLLMGFSFLSVGLVSLNLIYVFHANLEYLIDNGVMGLREGGLEQFVGLLLSGYLGMALYVVFKTCEKVLVDRVLERRQPPKTTVLAEASTG